MSKFNIGDSVTGVNKGQCLYGRTTTITEVCGLGGYHVADHPAMWFDGELKFASEEKQVETPQPTIVDDVTVKFSDGVVICTNSVTFDGKTYDRKDLRATIKRYTEILNRPLPKVPQPGDPVRSKKAAVKKTVKKVAKK